jgi:hypothetical protein
LEFFHFSGFNDLQPFLLSKHSDKLVDRGSALHCLVDRYLTSLNLCATKLSSLEFFSNNELKAWHQSNRSFRLMRAVKSSFCGLRGFVHGLCLSAIFLC